MTPVYPEAISEARETVSELWEEKRKVYDSLSEEQEGIVEREYNNVLLDLRDKGLVESGREDFFMIVDNPYYRPKYQND